MRLPPTLAILLAAIGALAACGDDGADGACGATTREALDPNYLVHVLSDEGTTYLSDPPTSGAHQPTPPNRGIEQAPLTRPVQVGILERGDVLLQYRPSLSADDVATLEALVGEQVVVAPNPDLDTEVVATAWLFKRSCDEVDTAALTDFIDERVGHGPEG